MDLKTIAKIFEEVNWQAVHGFHWKDNFCEKRVRL